ncbi:MAG: TrmB family transcriptional regulator [Candidatus Njordarchaeales archaeon]
MAKPKIKPKIIEALKEGPKTVDEIVSYVGAEARIVKGVLTKMVKRGEVVEEEGKYKLPE